MLNESAANNKTPILEFTYEIGEWILNTNTNQLTRGNRTIELENRVTNLLVYFLQHRNQILTKDDILKALWQNKVVNEENLAVAISLLRKALEDNARTPKYIKTIPGIGYQFIMQPTTGDQSSRNQSSETKPPAVSFLPNKYLLSVVVVLTVIVVFGLIFLLKVNSLATLKKTEPIAEQKLNSYEQASALLKNNSKQNWNEAIALFHEAIDNNQQAAKAYVGIAEAKIKLLDNRTLDNDSNSEIRALLLKALELDPSLASAHQWLANLAIWHDHNYLEAEQHFQISLGLNPNDDWTHAGYAHLLLIQRRFPEARAQVILARALNPLRYAAADIAFIYLAEGNYELAAHELDRISTTEQEDYFFHTTEQNIYYSTGNEQKTFENMQWFFKRADFSADKTKKLNQLFSQGGLTAVYRWLLESKETADVGQYTPPLSWARYAAAIGEKKLAMDYLEQAYKKQQPHIECAKADPRYTPLYDEDRFKKLIKQLSNPVAK